MPRESKPRPVVFFAVSLLLVASGVAFSRSEFSPRADGEGQPVEPTPSQLARRVATETARLHAQVELAAKRFLPAFFRYEVGDIDARVRRELHATATPEFAAALLAIPPRPPRRGGFPLPARLQSLTVNFAEGAAFNAFVDGVALRGATPQRLSFEFEYSQGRWRASGVTE